jgi:uncharacterized protein YvpB
MKFHFVSVCLITVLLSGWAAAAQDKLPQTVQQPVREYTQKYPLSCEAAAASVALQFLGLAVTEDQILAKLPYDKTPKSRDAQGGVVWGDPEKGFVGDYNGSYLKTGYGIYAAPLAGALTGMGITATAGRNLKIESLYQAVAAGQTVVVWVPTRFEHVQVQTWTTPEGKPVKWIEHEHAMVFRGYNRAAGTVSLMDVHFGKYQTRTVREFLRGWGYLDNQAIIFGKS